MSLLRRKKPGQSLLQAAAQGDLAQLREQLEAGVDPNVCNRAGVSAIGIAASRGWAEGVAILLEAGVDPSQQIRNSEPGAHQGPLLNFPAANGSIETVRLLVEAGAALDDADPTGITPLVAAAYMGHESIVRLLCQAGAGLELRDQEGYTALMFAANAGHAAAAQVLLEAGADPNAPANDGSTPLMFAAQHGHDEVVVELLGGGADPEVEGTHGLSAIGLARQNGHKRTLALLQRREGGNT